MPLLAVERRIAFRYYQSMENDRTGDAAPAGWLEILEESEAELAAGLTVPGDAVRQMLRDSLAKIEARQGTTPPRRAKPRR